MSDRRQFLSSLLLEQEHEKHLRRAIALRANNPRAPYAAVPVDAAKNEIVAEGWNKSPQNPLLHGGNGYHQSRRRTAAGDRLGGTRAVHDRRTVSAEPCPPNRVRRTVSDVHGRGFVGGDSDDRLWFFDSVLDRLRRQPGFRRQPDRYPCHGSGAADRFPQGNGARRSSGRRVQRAVSGGHRTLGAPKLRNEANGASCLRVSLR